MLAFVGAADSLDVQMFRLGADGAFALLATVPLPDAPLPSRVSLPLTFSPDGDVLFVSVRSKPFCIKSFRLDRREPGLAYLSSAEVPGSLADISVDATGRYLFGASYPDNLICVLPIGSDGKLGAVQQRIDLPGRAHAITPDPTNRFVVVTLIDADRLWTYRLDSPTGRLDFVGETVSRKASGPRHMVFQPDGLGLYVVNEYDGLIDVFDFDPENGALQLRSTASILPANCYGRARGADLRITPDGRYLYASERATSTIAAFRCEPAMGRLAPIGHFVSEASPRTLAIDPQGRHLLAAGQLSRALTAYAIDPATGALSPQHSYPPGAGIMYPAGAGIVAQFNDVGALSPEGFHPMGRNPSWIEIVDERG
jgi:6-phosphogluconolactonase